MANKSLLLTFVILFGVLLSGCAKKSEQTAAKGNGMKYAQLLGITPEEGYTRVDVRTEANGEPVATYLLVPKDKEVPSNLPKGEVIRVPVSSLVVNSSIYAHPLKELGSIGVIKGVIDAPYFSMPEIKAGLQNGSITDIGNMQQPSVEKIVTLHPDGIMINLFEGMTTSEMPTAGVPYLKFADNLEYTPLGRAEWIKFLGLLTGKEKEAQKIFNQVEAEYNALLQQSKEATNKPKVLVENMYEGVWYVPGGNSVSAQMLNDAGATYPWAQDKRNGSLPLTYEEVLSKAGDADIWLLKVFGQQLTKASLAEMDKRYTQFQPYKTGKIWYSDTSTSGLFDYSAFHPETVLSDYLIIIHPELAKGKTPRYFKQIAP